MADADWRNYPMGRIPEEQDAGERASEIGSSAPDIDDRIAAFKAVRPEKERRSANARPNAGAGTGTDEQPASQNALSEHYPARFGLRIVGVWLASSVPSALAFFMLVLVSGSFFDVSANYYMEATIASALHVAVAAAIGLAAFPKSTRGEGVLGAALPAICLYFYFAGA